MTSRAIIDTSMTRQDGLVEATAPYLTLAEINYAFDVTEYRFTDEAHLDNYPIPEASLLEGYVYQGDIYWDDFYTDGTIEVSYQNYDPNIGYITDIYPGHDSWGTNGYAWDANYPPMKQEAGMYWHTTNLSLDNLDHTFVDFDVYFTSLAEERAVASEMLAEAQVYDSSGDFTNYDIGASNWEPVNA